MAEFDGEGKAAVITLLSVLALLGAEVA